MAGTHRADGSENELTDRDPSLWLHGGRSRSSGGEAAGWINSRYYAAGFRRRRRPEGLAARGGAVPRSLWGNNVDLSSRGFLGREEKKLPGVRLLAVQTPDLAAACEFYQRQFDLRSRRLDRMMERSA